MKEKQVKLNGKDYTIKEMPIRRLVESLAFLKKIPEQLEGMGDVKGTSDTALLFQLIGGSANEVFAILSKATEIEQEEIENFGLADTAKLFKTVLEVNDFNEIKKEIGDITKMFQAPQGGLKK
jgi:hypothetical protein